MSELRLNLVTKEWVIIATERARRPRDFLRAESRAPAQDYMRECPFCAGNEPKTPDETYRVPTPSGWLVRVVSNKYPAVSRTGEKERVIEGMRRMVSGVGSHEIIVEGPRHDESIPLLPIDHIKSVVRTYKNRFIEAYMDQRVEHVIIFKNHGPGSGTSIEHPHSQLIAIPVVPVQFRDRVQSAMHYFDDTGDCLVCAVLRKEREEGARVIIDTEHFTTFIPYAALSPFHTWIFPKRHSASFADISEEEISDLAVHMKAYFGKLYYGLDNPDYNYVIRSSRPRDSGNEYCHWYLSVVPRITQAAGFELGSGMYINTSLPEESADFLRKARATE